MWAWMLKGGTKVGGQGREGWKGGRGGGKETGGGGRLPERGRGGGGEQD